MIELDPAIVDRSPFRDRIGDEFDADFEKLKASVSESGQQVPVLVRPIPSRRGGTKRRTGIVGCAPLKHWAVL